MYALLLSDDADETSILAVVLQRSGLAVNKSRDLDQTMRIWLERPVDLIMLAIAKPTLTEQIRLVRAEAQVPLVLVTDPLEEKMQVSLLEMGADLVVSRPFSARMLMAQVRTLMRRAKSVPLFSLPTLKLAGLSLDPTSRMVQVDRLPAKRLTHLEFRLLYTLMIHKGQVLPTDTIVERVWGYNGRGDRELVRGLISRLRAKIEDDPRHPGYILTVPGVGYTFREEGVGEIGEWGSGGVGE